MRSPVVETKIGTKGALTMQHEVRSTEVDARHDDESGIISETILEFSENSEMNEGMCSCVCINDEKCCGCLIQ